MSSETNPGCSGLMAVATFVLIVVAAIVIAAIRSQQ